MKKLTYEKRKNEERGKDPPFLLSTITENSQNDKPCNTMTDEISENKKYIEKLINSIDERINVTDSILKISLDKRPNDLQIKMNESKINENKLNESKMNENKMNESRMNENKMNERKITDTKMNESKINEKKINENKINENKIKEKMNEYKKNTSKNNENNMNEIKMDECKIHDNKNKGNKNFVDNLRIQLEEKNFNFNEIKSPSSQSTQSKKEKSEIKVNINRGTDYSHLFQMKSRSFHRTGNSSHSKKDQSFMIEILKMKKKDTLRDVEQLNKEIRLLEKEKEKDIKNQFFRSYEFIKF